MGAACRRRPGDDPQSGQAGSRPELGPRPGRPVPARHGLVQAGHAPVRLAAFRRHAGALHPHQPHGGGPARRSGRRGRAPAPARPRPRAPLHQVRADLARRQHLLRAAQHLRRRVHRVARRLFVAAVPPVPRGRAAAARLRGAVGAGHPLGDPRARHRLRAADAARLRPPRRDGPRHPVRARRPGSGPRSSAWPASRGSGSPTSARGGATPSSGTSTSSRSSPPSCRTPSPAPRTPTWPTSTTSRPSAPTRTSCPWCSRPWRASAASGGPT